VAQGFWNSLFCRCDSEIVWLMKHLVLMEEHIMATLKDVTNALEALKTTAAEERTEVLAVLDDMKAQIAALQEQIASGTSVTAADLDVVMNQIADAAAVVEGIQE
jgi:hypothetical protein